jgi:hypothetical protein
MKAKAAIVTLCLLTLIVSVPRSSWGEGVREKRPNIVGGELIGRSIILTVNYERYFTNVFGLGAGLMGLATDDGSVFLVPVYVNLNPVGDTKSLYLSAGITFLGGGTAGEVESENVITIGVGFQYQAYGGFMVRPALYMLLGDFEDGADYFMWPGLSIGGSF